jgi:hypothetical protein
MLAHELLVAPVPGGPPGGGGKHPRPSHPPGATVLAPAVGHGEGGAWGGMGGHAGCQPGVEVGGKASLSLPLPPARRGAPPVLMSLLLPLAPRGRSPRPRWSLHIRQHREGEVPAAALLLPQPPLPTSQPSSLRRPSPVVCTQKGVRCYREGDRGAAPQKTTIRSPE